jgi:hypothetical protein
MHRLSAQLIVTIATPYIAGRNTFALERAVDERHFAIDMSNTSAFMAQRGNLKLNRFGRKFLFTKSSFTHKGIVSIN